jgi:hypothetical protein
MNSSGKLTRTSAKADEALVSSLKTTQPRKLTRIHCGLMGRGLNSHFWDRRQFLRHRGDSLSALSDSKLKIGYKDLDFYLNPPSASGWSIFQGGQKTGIDDQSVTKNRT